MSDDKTEFEKQLESEMLEVNLQRLFIKLTLALAGVFYRYPIPDHAVWDATRCLDNIFRDELGIPPKEIVVFKCANAKQKSQKYFSF